MIQSSNGNIFGYQQVWSGINIYKKDEKAFLFSLKNNYNMPLMMPIKSNETGSIYCSPLLGPTFGSKKSTPSFSFGNSTNQPPNFSFNSINASSIFENEHDSNQ